MCIWLGFGCLDLVDLQWSRCIRPDELLFSEMSPWVTVKSAKVQKNPVRLWWPVCSSAQTHRLDVKGLRWVSNKNAYIFLTQRNYFVCRLTANACHRFLSDDTTPGFMLQHRLESSEVISLSVRCMQIPENPLNSFDLHRRKRSTCAYLNSLGPRAWVVLNIESRTVEPGTCWTSDRRTAAVQKRQHETPRRFVRYTSVRYPAPSVSLTPGQPECFALSKRFSISSVSFYSRFPNR